MDIEADIELDAAGLNCPLPILKTKKALASMQPGQTIHVIATDPGSLPDFRSFARQTGHHLHLSEARGDRFHFVLEKA